MTERLSADDFCGGEFGEVSFDPLVLVSTLACFIGDFCTFPDNRLIPVVPATTGVVNVFLLLLLEQLDVVVVAMVVVALVMVVFGDDAGELD